MNHFAIITAFGQDRPGIVALMADSLYRLGCNIEDTCMTRLRGEFTMMLMVRLPEGMAAEDLARRLTPYTTPLDLAVLCRAMPDLAATRQTALEIPTFILSVYGADHPGIVAQVARTVARHQGNITDMSRVSFATDGMYTVPVTGDMTMHGVTKKLSTTGTITIKGGKVSAVSKFFVKLADYNISIPNLVKDNIAESVEVTVSSNFDQKM